MVSCHGCCESVVGDKLRVLFFAKRKERLKRK